MVVLLLAPYTCQRCKMHTVKRRISWSKWTSSEAADPQENDTKGSDGGHLVEGKGPGHPHQVMKILLDVNM